MIKVGIIGANGYLGIELIRILSMHPNVKLSKIFQRELPIDEEFPHLQSLNLKDTQTDNLDDFKNLDCVFLALPHGSAHEYVKELISKVKIIDLSSDFRISNQEDYNKYYKSNFDVDTQSQFQYGFIENSSDEIKKSSNISNPGCFALTTQLSLLPFHSIIKNVSVTAITGSSGGGKNPTNKNHHSTRSKDIFSYNINSHRHLAEIYQSFPNLRKNLSFVPLSGPFSRGIYLTSHIETKETINNDFLDSCLADYFKSAPFIRIQNNTKLSNVIGSNFCDIAVSFKDENHFVVEACLDNLVKGASGNAVECMNLIFDQDQALGLNQIIPLYL